MDFAIFTPRNNWITGFPTAFNRCVQIHLVFELRVVILPTMQLSGRTGENIHLKSHILRFISIRTCTLRSVCTKELSELMLFYDKSKNHQNLVKFRPGLTLSCIRTLESKIFSHSITPELLNWCIQGAPKQHQNFEP